ncbi:MAG: hypothetical protein A3A80_04140 [Candidatus Terrybacteria bacterium RIFCSPLOWO2_01_FULL_44_24]|uniref:Uncharacterized protein n=1 Tax=Candidatus Terrybacteria bacterium RIFCSPHIGHO2_01_FULL_43_35 TaxID=1802361 RepID=A0A1G2PDB7_9BACT|nr:MAG: hypothetical protein A2828_00775 [Candidatus Terrybacteria bacterium RIFCSPHIGHO2_01_FULL_43_35]OHA50196.1 MAG: hypothetical protein A3B75_01725 [Candidatus Terrybacteria bacterium RIFCSPHIGHO2_02_FULL_43_14]OHA51255.1 MAG: hypothetical protein A3A80_04140 [Candidatus Terrybacteria bacterium RIFCSPLOWO2_01_FULL_44_24]
MASSIKKNSTVKILTIILFFIFVFASVFSQVKYNDLAAAKKKKHLLQVFLPPATLVDTFSFGFKNFLADIFWIQSIQYLAVEGLMPGSLMGQYFDVVTQLDPKFEYPYLLADIILPKFGSIDDARRLTDRGIGAIPESWQLPYYLAVQYHSLKKDYANALKYIKVAADNPQSPPLVKALLASYTLKSGNLINAKYLFQIIYDTSENEYTKELAKSWIRQIGRIELLEAAVATYQSRFGYYPKTLRDVVALGILKEIPSELGNFNFVVDQQTGALSIK